MPHKYLVRRCILPNFVVEYKSAVIVYSTANSVVMSPYVRSTARHVIHLQFDFSAKALEIRAYILTCCGLYLKSITNIKVSRFLVYIVPK
jgi:hypothetical protein